MDIKGDATLRDVAKLAGVSVGSVSRFLNNDPSLSVKLSVRISDAITELHYTPNAMARQLAKGRSNTLLLYILHEQPISPTTWLYKLSIIQSIETYLKNTDYSLQIALNTYLDTDGSYQFISKNINSRSVDGILIISAWDIHPKTVDLMTSTDFPFALIGVRNPAGDFNEVRSDIKQAIIDLVCILHGNGHKKLAFFGGYQKQQHNVERLEGFKNALEIYGLQTKDEWIRFGDYSVESGYDFCNELLSLPKSMWPTAIVCGNDYIAAGVVKAINEHPLSPAITVTGFDGTVVSKIVSPPFVTVEIPLAEMGERAAKILLSNIQSGKCIFESQTYLCEIKNVW